MFQPDIMHSTFHTSEMEDSIKHDNMAADDEPLPSADLVNLSPPISPTLIPEPRGPRKFNRRTLPLDEKIKLIQDFEWFGFSKRKLAKKFNCGKTQVAQIIQKKAMYKDEWAKNPCSSRFRFADRPFKAAFEDNLYEWCIRNQNEGVCVTGPMIRKKALELAHQAGITTEKFKASSGWLDRFKKNYDVKLGATYVGPPTATWNSNITLPLTNSSSLHGEVASGFDESGAIVFADNQGQSNLFSSVAPSSSHVPMRREVTNRQLSGGLNPRLQSIFNLPAESFQNISNPYATEPIDIVPEESNGNQILGHATEIQDSNGEMPCMQTSIKLEPISESPPPSPKISPMHTYSEDEAEMNFLKEQFQKRKQNKRHVLTLEDRINLIKDHEELKMSSRMLAQKYKCGKTQVSIILKSKQKWQTEWNSNRNSKCSRIGSRKYRTVFEDDLYKWYTQHTERGFKITNAMLQKKALALSAKAGISRSQFMASNGWLHCFKKYYSIGSSGTAYREPVQLSTEGTVRGNCDVRESGQLSTEQTVPVKQESVLDSLASEKSTNPDSACESATSVSAQGESTDRKHKRNCLTLEQKIQLLDEFENSKISARKLANKYKVGKTQVSLIIKGKKKYQDEWAKNPNSGRKRFQARPYKEAFEDDLHKWYVRMTSHGFNITAIMLRKKAQSLASEAGLLNFKASNGWLSRFRRHYNISSGNNKKSPAKELAVDSHDIEDSLQGCFKVKTEAIAMDGDNTSSKRSASKSWPMLQLAASVTQAEYDDADMVQNCSECHQGIPLQKLKCIHCCEYDMIMSLIRLIESNFKLFFFVPAI